MATIKDVAKLANVSPGTVTRFFNKQPLKESNRLRVEQAIRQLNYSVNPIARSLRSKKSYMIGVLVPILSEGFSTQIITAAERYVIECGYSLMICLSSGVAEIERERLQFLMDKKIDGLILFSTGKNTDLLNEMIASGIAIVSIDSAPDGVPCDAVLADNINITYQITEHLISNGHRRIGIMLGGLGYMTARERFEGYRRALSDYKIELDESLQYILVYSPEAGYNAMDYFMQLTEPPTAVIATNYDLALGSVIFMNEHNIGVPEDISLVAFDFQELHQVVKPKISVALQPVQEIGQTAARMVLERINAASSDNSEGQFSQKIARLKFKFVQGNSVKTLNS